MPGKAEAFKAPLLADPGTTFTYGINTDWLGRVVEAVAGTTLDVVVKEKITGPLGMGDTMFRLDDQRTANCVTRARPRRGRELGLRRRNPQPGRPTGGRADTGCTPRRATTSGSSGRCCGAVSWTASGS